MIMEVKVPEVGESITEGVLVAWLIRDGAWVERDEPLFELETDKITMAVPAEHAGRLQVKVPVQSTVLVGQVVALLDTDAAAKSTPPPPDATAHAPTQAAPASATPPAAPAPAAAAPPSPAPPAAAAQAPPGAKDSDLPLSPAVRRLVAEHQLNPAAIAGTGKDGRLTKADILKQISSATTVPAPHTSRSTTLTSAPSSTPPTSITVTGKAAPPTEQTPTARQSRVRMSSLRRRIAERLVQAQQSAAILSTFNEVDMTAVKQLRARYKEQFVKRYDVRLGFMSFFVKAAVDALQTVPALNAQIQGDEIVQNHFYDIGVAIGSKRGLVVPVIRDCDQLSIAELERAIASYAEKAQSGALTIADLTGGVFTISNGGVYGSLLSTPILNPPQSGILGMHAIKDRPMVVNGEIAVRPMMYLALSYDHRLVDGSEAVTFLKRIVECIEEPERLLLQI